MKKADDLKIIKELLEIVKHKVNMMEFAGKNQSAQVSLMRDQQSLMNEKLDDITTEVRGLKVDIEKLNKKADGILEFAEGVDNDLQDHKKRLTRIERVPVIAHALNK